MLIAPAFVLTAAHCVSDGLVSWVAIGYSGKSPQSEGIQVLTDRIRRVASLLPNRFMIGGLRCGRSGFRTAFLFATSEAFANAEAPVSASVVLTVQGISRAPADSRVRNLRERLLLEVARRLFGQEMLIHLRFARHHRCKSV